MWVSGKTPWLLFDHPEADADSDGDTDGNDFLIWQRQFGSGVVAAAKHATVPEPSSLLLGVMAVVGLLVRRR